MINKKPILTSTLTSVVAHVLLWVQFPFSYNEKKKTGKTRSLIFHVMFAFALLSSSRMGDEFVIVLHMYLPFLHSNLLRSKAQLL